jgi:membrane protein implicated in regulation of membrane protease activity
MQNILKAFVAIIGIVLVAVLLFDAIQGSNPVSYIKAATAVLLTVLLLRNLRRNTQQSQEITPSNRRNVKMVAAGLAVGLIFPIIFLWLVKSAVN